LINSLKNNRTATLELVKEMSKNNEIRDSENRSRVKDEYKDEMIKMGLTEEL
jgi:hypothetical protein